MSTITKLKNDKKARKIKIAVAAILVGLAIAAKMMTAETTEKPRSFSQYMADYDGGRIASMEIKNDYWNDTIVIHLKDKAALPYSVTSPRVNLEAVSGFTKKGIAVTYPPAPFDFGKTLNEIVMLAMLAYFVFIISQSVPGLPSLSRNTRKSDTKFEDVAGAEEAKGAMEEIVTYLRDPAQFERLGAKFPKGIMLFGEPGNGKTLLAKAVAGEAGVPFHEMNGADFGSMFLGVSGTKVKRLFSRARHSAPCVVFIDEIDAIGGRRMTEGSSAAREMSSTLNQLLTQMDGFTENTGVVVIGATNRLETLDPALLRAGRFDRHIQIQRPGMSAREEILAVHTRGVSIEPNFDYALVARNTMGMSGADLANLINTAALVAAREKADVVTTAHALQAKDDILMGQATNKTSTSLDDDTRRIIAIHECGHAVVSMAYGHDPVTLVSILARGKSLGVTMMAPEADRVIHDKSYIMARLAIFLAGRMSEVYFEGRCTTGAEDDIDKATSLATDVVRRYGMGSMGMMKISENSSAKLHYEADLETSNLLKTALQAAHKILSDNKDVVRDMADYLMKHEEIRSPEQLEGYRSRLVKAQPFDVSIASSGMTCLPT